MLVTISRQFGAGGAAVAARVGSALGWRVVDNDFVDRVATRIGCPRDEVAAREERGAGFVERLAATLAGASLELFAAGEVPAPDLDEADLVRVTESVVAEVAAEGNVVLVGRAGAAVLGQRPDALHVRVVADREFRIGVAAERLRLPRAEVARVLDETDANRARYHRVHYARDWADPVHYDLVLNTGRLGFDAAAALVVAAVTRR